MDRLEHCQEQVPLTPELWGRVLAILLPEHYGERPSPSEPADLSRMTREERISFLAFRWSRGLSPRHEGDITASDSPSSTGELEGDDTEDY